jgi:hypothetical protein
MTTAPDDDGYRDVTVTLTSYPDRVTAAVLAAIVEQAGVRVIDLLPGDHVTMPGARKPATFVASTAHPLWPHLQLVVWRLPAGHSAGDWSHDALDLRQVAGTRVPSTHGERQSRLRDALMGGAA